MRQTFCCFCNTLACAQHNSLIICTFTLRESLTCFNESYFITAVNHKKDYSPVFSLHKMAGSCRSQLMICVIQHKCIHHNTYTHIYTRLRYTRLYETSFHICLVFLCTSFGSYNLIWTKSQNLV